MTPFQFVILWETVGLLSVLIILFLIWLDGNDIFLKDITLGMFISIMGWFVPILTIAFLISESMWWFKLTQKTSQLIEKSSSEIILKGRKSKTIKEKVL